MSNDLVQNGRIRVRRGMVEVNHATSCSVQYCALLRTSLGVITRFRHLTSPQRKGDRALDNTSRPFGEVNNQLDDK
jgi:hypothetical protein